MDEETQKTIGIGSYVSKNNITDWASLLKGFLSGSLVIGSVVNPFGMVSVLLFIIGIYVFIDTVMPFGRPIFPVSTVFSFIIGGIAVFAVTLGYNNLPYLPVVVVITILLYLSKISNYYSLIRHSK